MGCILSKLWDAFLGELWDALINVKKILVRVTPTLVFFENESQKN